MSPDGFIAGPNDDVAAPRLSQNFIHSQRSISDLLTILRIGLSFLALAKSLPPLHENLVHFF